MRFVLTYSGPLPPAGARAAGVDLRHRIRSEFARQLADLLGLPPLAGAGFWDGSKNPDLRRQVGDAWFAPIVTSTFHGLAELDVLMLRPGPPGKLIHDGDLDNRLKTLLDCLRRPQQASELPDGLLISKSDAMPVLLDDDSLVSRVSAETERLLGPQESRDLQVVIRVTTRVTEQTWGGLLLS